MPPNRENIGRIPPHSIEAEQSVIGSLLIDKEAIFKVMDILSPEDFYKAAHKTLYSLMIELSTKQEPIDIISLSNALKSKNQIEAIGGSSYLSTLSTLVPTAAHIVNHAKIVQKKAILRRVLKSATKLTELGYNEDESIESIVDYAETSILDISHRIHTHSVIPINTLLTDAFERLDDIHKNKGKLRGVPTHFNDLDNTLSGLQKSDLIVIASRPSVGKTSFALDIARNVAVKENLPVAIFSLEMSNDQLVDRLICAEAKINLWKLRTGNLSHRGENDDFSKISNALGKLSDAPLFIDDTALTHVMGIKSRARRLQMEKGLGLIIIDYLQLMEGMGASESRVQEVSQMTRLLKGMARELNVPVVALSQLNRAVEMGGGPAIPKLAHLRESGSIEQDADIVMFIYRKKADPYFKQKEMKPEDVNTAEIIVAKHRNGPTGVVNLYFNEETASFQSLSADAISDSYEAVAE